MKYSCRSSSMNLTKLVRRLILQIRDYPAPSKDAVTSITSLPATEGASIPAAQLLCMHRRCHHQKAVITTLTLTLPMAAERRRPSHSESLPPLNSRSSSRCAFVTERRPGTLPASAELLLPPSDFRLPRPLPAEPPCCRPAEGLGCVAELSERRLPGPASGSGTSAAWLCAGPPAS